MSNDAAIIGKTLGVGVVGCGLIGSRRADCAHMHPQTRLVATADVAIDAAKKVALCRDALAFERWQDVVDHDDVDIVAVATPNGSLAEVACAALQAGKHVLVEKPMGRTLEEAVLMKLAADASGRRLKIGFNHRYHPALAEAHRLFAAGEIGPFINARVRYGHGGRPGYEKEWRGDPALAGGGELTDQGVHVIDLLQWFIGGPPREVFGFLQTAVWPLGKLEDNAFALLRWADGGVASLHTAWTQWKNLFSFELFGTKGSLVVDGLGHSYGTETLTIAHRRSMGGVPEIEVITYEGPDKSWMLEWTDFVAGIIAGKPFLGEAAEGVEVMRTLHAIYRAAESGAPAKLIN
jgi:predicted dehydrogenase